MPNFSPIYEWAQGRLLQPTLSAFETAYPEYALETRDLVGVLLARYPCIGSYESLTGADKTNFDAATGKLLAGRLRRIHLLGANAGAGILKRKTVGDTTKEYFGPVLPGQKTLEEEWADEALVNLENVACVAAALDAASTGFSPHKASGPTRARQTRFPGYLRNALYDLLLPTQLQGVNPLSGNWDGWAGL